MKQLKAAMVPIEKDSGIQTKIINREDEPDKYVRNYVIGFNKAVKPADFFRLEIAINEYFDRTVELLPADAKEHDSASKAYLKAEPIQAEPNRAKGYMGLILEPNVPESHERYPAVINALENVVVAAKAAKGKK